MYVNVHHKDGQKQNVSYLSTQHSALSSNTNTGCFWGSNHSPAFSISRIAVQLCRACYKWMTWMIVVLQMNDMEVKRCQKYGATSFHMKYSWCALRQIWSTGLFLEGVNFVECACDYHSVSCLQSSHAWNYWMVLACLLQCFACLPFASIALFIGWSNDWSQFGCSCNVSFF